MFQYTREIIINDQAFEQRENAVTGMKELFIPFVGSYRTENIKKVLHAPFKDPKFSELTLPTSVTAGIPTTRFTIKMSLQAGEVDALLANYTTLFKRGLVIEVPEGANAARIKEIFVEALRGMEEFPIRLDITAGKIIAKTPFLNLQLLTEELKYRDNSISEMVITKVTEGAISKGTVPFGTYEMLIKDNRLPTLDNVRPWGENQEELPIKGQKYDLFEITYVAERNIGGFGVLGQQASSITYHRFWVRQDKKASFEAILTAVTAVPPVEEGE